MGGSDLLHLPFREFLYFDEINNAYFILRVYIVGLSASEMNGMSRKKLLGIADKILILPSRDRLFVYS